MTKGGLWQLMLSKRLPQIVFDTKGVKYHINSINIQ